MKKSFSFIELIFVVLLLSIVFTQIKPNKQNAKLKELSDKIKLNLSYTRYISHVDNKHDIDDLEWQKKLWTLKFQRCKESVGGFYYVIYSDTSGGTAHFKKVETLKDPLSNKYLYSNSDCKASKDESKYVLLTQEYGINKIDVSCNSTDAIGQISFGYDGKIYSKLGTSPKEITNKCFITLYDDNNDFVKIIIEPKTGFIY